MERTWEDYVRKSGLLIVLSGPSGVGKDALLKEFQKLCPDVRRCITTTTRPRREHETDGVDYNFISQDEFRRRVCAGAFLEHAVVHGHLYGTPRKWVEDNLSRGLDIMLQIDVQGALAVKREMPSAVLVFVVPPSLEELESRLRGRATDSERDVATRLANALGELKHIHHYEYVVENDSLLRAAEELRAIILAEHCRIRQPGD